MTFHRNSLEILINLYILAYAQTWPTWKGRREAAFRVPQGSVCLSPKPPHRPCKSVTCRRQLSDAMLEDPRFRPKILAGRRLFVPGYRKRLILEHPAIDFCSSPKNGRSGDLGRTSVDDPQRKLRYPPRKRACPSFDCHGRTQGNFVHLSQDL